MSPNFTWSDARWSLQVQEMIRALGVAKLPFLKEQLRFLLEKIIAFTPPHSKSQGGGAVQSDIRNLIQPFAVDTFRDKRLKKIVETKNFGAFAAFTRDSGNPALQGAVAVDAAEVATLHARSRNNRGRVAGRFKNFVLGATDRRALKEYIRRKMDNVGMARSGWLSALSAVGGSMAAVATTTWVSRHGSEFGSFRSNLDDPDKPSLDAINNTPWASRQDEGQRIIANAQASRVTAMKKSLEVQLELAAEKAGLKAA